MGNPAGSAPDEGSHYLKALAVSVGKPAGERVTFPRPPPKRKGDAWVQRTARAVEVPPGLSPEGLQCNAGHPRQSAACQEGIHPPEVATRSLSLVGTAQPTTYLLPGILARLAANPVTAIQLGRAGNAVLSLGLIVTAILLLWERSLGVVSIVGLLAAVTPMAVLLASSLTASGPEVAAGLCFFSALLRVTRDLEPRTWNWVALGVSGALLAASRSLGPLWVGLGVTVIVVAHGFRPSWLVLRSAGRRAAWAAAAVTVAVGVSVGWEMAVQPHGPFDLVALKGALPHSRHDLHRVLGELIGVFGSLDSPMPTYAYVFWWAMLAGLGLLALWLGPWRQRVVLMLLLAGAVPLTLAIAMLNLAQTGFGTQGRYVLPMLVSVPLFAGEMAALRPWPGTPTHAVWPSARTVPGCS